MEQDKGDEVLALFGRELSGIPGTATVRDGGDEFLVLGAPGFGGLDAALEEFRRRWLAAFQFEFGTDVPVVAPRVLTTTAHGGTLRQAREHLGRDVGTLKGVKPPAPGLGIQKRLRYPDL
jgi:hypothetical protein